MIRKVAKKENKIHRKVLMNIVKKMEISSLLASVKMIRPFTRVAEKADQEATGAKIKKELEGDISYIRWINIEKG